MKKMKFLFVAFGVMILASCASPGEKSSGSYEGSYAINGYIIPGKIMVNKASDGKVNMVLTSYSPVMTDNADGVSVTADGEDVIFAYSNATTTYGDMISINGTLVGNKITLDGVMCLGGAGSSGFGVFTGTK